MASFVLDASVVLPWCFDDETTAYTEGLLNRCAAGEEVMVASVWPLEITNGSMQPVKPVVREQHSPALSGSAGKNLLRCESH